MKPATVQCRHPANLCGKRNVSPGHAFGPALGRVDMRARFFEKGGRNC